MNLAGFVRVAGWLLVAAGLSQSLVACVRDEGVNAAGVVPGVAIGFALVSVGGYALLAAGYLRMRMLRWTALPAGLTMLVVSTVAVLTTGHVPPAVYAVGGRGLVGLVVFVGYFVTLGTVVMLVLYAVFSALGWLADQVPALRRRGVGDVIRGGGRPNFGQTRDRSDASQR